MTFRRRAAPRRNAPPRGAATRAAVERRGTCSSVLADLPTRQFQEQVFEVGRAVQGAQLVVFAQRQQQGLRLGRVEEHRFTAHLDPRRQQQP